MSKRILTLALLILTNIATGFTQVTIGSIEKPIEGALLQLKENENLGANTTKGLQLPRVIIKDINELNIGIENIPKSEYMDHKGLIVFNTAGLTPGIYIWNGAEWQHLMTKEVEHPRILLLKGEETTIKNNILSSEFLKKTNDIIISKTDQIIPTVLLKRELTGKRLLSVSREALRKIFCLSYAYRMTNDKKYLIRAEDELVNISGFIDWNPSHFLDVAEMTMAVAIGYDWLYNDLSKESKDIIKEAIISKGLIPSNDPQYNKSFLYTNSNWNQVCNAGLLYGALAIYEDSKELAQSIIDRSIESIKIPMNAYSPNGAYPEGPGYWEYGTVFNVMLLDALDKLFKQDYGLSQLDGFLDSSKFYLHSKATSMIHFNYSDAGTALQFTPAIFWFANKTKDYSLLFDEFKFANQSSNDHYLGHRLSPAIMIWGDGITNEQNLHPTEIFWKGDGITPIAFMRTSWDDKNALFTGLKAGKASTNHGHMDVGSFILESDGIRWALDLGAQDYTTLEQKGYDIWNMSQNSFRWNLFRYNCFSHNTITVNDKPHLVNAKAEITSFSDQPNFMFAISDISNLFENEIQSSRRGVALINSEYVLIQDEIKTLENKAAKIRWAMATDSNPTVKGKNVIELTKNGKKLTIQVGSSVNADMNTWSANPINDYDAVNKNVTMVGFEIEIPKNTEVTIFVSLLPGGVSYSEQNFRSLDHW